MRRRTYTLGLQVCATKTVMMLIEIHHLHSLELLRNLPYLLFLARLLDFDTLRVPGNILFVRHVVYDETLLWSSSEQVNIQCDVPLLVSCQQTQW